VHYHTPQNYTTSRTLLTPITPYRSDEERGLLLHKLWYSDVQRWVGELLLSVYRAVHTAVWADEIEGDPRTKLSLFNTIALHFYISSFLLFFSFCFRIFIFIYLFSESSLYDLFCTDGVRDASRSDSIKIPALSQAKKIALLSTFDMRDASKK
jgi:hypothetical protein